MKYRSAEVIVINAMKLTFELPLQLSIILYSTNN
jgi:hypothetical protein